MWKSCKNSILSESWVCASPCSFYFFCRPLITTSSTSYLFRINEQPFSFHLGCDFLLNNLLTNFATRDFILVFFVTVYQLRSCVLCPRVIYKIYNIHVIKNPILQIEKMFCFICWFSGVLYINYFANTERTCSLRCVFFIFLPCMLRVF